jgi:hypothetical protein
MALIVADVALPVWAMKTVYMAVILGVLYMKPLTALTASQLQNEGTN